MVEKAQNVDGIKKSESFRGGNEPKLKQPTPNNQRQNPRQVLQYAKQTPEFEQLNNLYRQNREAVVEEDLDGFAKNPPQKPDFPTIIFMTAVAKDTVDIIVFVATVGTAGWILIWTFNIIIIPILWLWMLGKISKAQKAMSKVIVRWFVGVIIGDTFLGPLPFWTLFVLAAHYRETKAVQLIFALMEKLDKVRHGNLKLIESKQEGFVRTTTATT